ncbi:MAG: T9SS type A sorting domain-containing protein, partial [Dysgonamonadaceae bacterium]|nr:T9SS type A sorting domain-containing protein [Dysgonamonadaceae bacterium]
GTFGTKDLSGSVDELIQIPFSGNAFVMQAYSFPVYQSGNFLTTFSADGSPLRSSTASVPSDNLLELTLSSAQSPYTDMLRIQRDDRYADDFILGEDALKMFSFPSSGKPEFYTVLGENRLVFDKRQQISGDIPLGIDLKGDDTYTISIDSKTGYNAESVLLVDYSSGVETLHNLSASPYVFQSGVSQSENHYALRIAQLTTGIEQKRESETEIVVYSLDRRLYVKNIRQDDAVWVYDASGRLLKGEQSDAEEFSCTLPQAGVYILKISGTRAYTTKIAVKF